MAGPCAVDRAEKRNPLRNCDVTVTHSLCHHCTNIAQTGRKVPCFPPTQYDRTGTLNAQWWGMEREIRYIAKCKACGCHTSGLTSGQNMNREKGDPKRTGSVYYHNPWPFALDCRLCGQPRFARMVRGKFRADIKCNGKCMSATGCQCECSCGGKNHGAGHGL